MSDHFFNSFGQTGLIVYFIFLGVYHCGEFVLAWIIHGKPDLRSFLFSWPYFIALLCSLTEYCIEWIYFYDWKSIHFYLFILIGSAGALTGLVIRFAAIITAHKSFTHRMRVQKCAEHKLVTHGIYKWFRHPGYFGWFIWTLFLQVLLKNPICLVLFAIWTWIYFYHRIRSEEQFLSQFFGEDYLKYKKRTSTWIPFI